MLIQIYGVTSSQRVQKNTHGRVPVRGMAATIVMSHIYLYTYKICPDKFVIFGCIVNEDKLWHKRRSRVLCRDKWDFVSMGFMNKRVISLVVKNGKFYWTTRDGYWIRTKPGHSSKPFLWASYQIRKIAGCACAGNAGNVSPRRRLLRKPLVSDPGMHHGTCFTHVPWCMSGSLTRGGGENVPGISGACATRNFT